MSDTRIVIARQGPREILKQRQEVLWNDGTSLWLHTTRHFGDACLFTRAIAVGNGRWLLFDLRQVDPTMDDDLPRLLPTMHAPRVFYTLRHRYLSASALRQDIALTGEMLLDEIGRPMEETA